MLDRVDSRDLIIVFSSCTRKGIRARYNYVRTLKEVPCNKLFLLDDFASDHRGSFYLGSNMKFEEAVVVRELIDRVREHTGQDVLIFPVSHFSVQVQTAGVCASVLSPSSKSAKRSASST